MSEVGVLPAIKRYMESNDDGWGEGGKGRRVPMDELKALSWQDREDFRAMLAAVGIETKEQAPQ